MPQKGHVYDYVGAAWYFGSLKSAGLKFFVQKSTFTCFQFNSTAFPFSCNISQLHLNNSIGNTLQNIISTPANVNWGRHFQTTKYKHTMLENSQFKCLPQWFHTMIWHLKYTVSDINPPPVEINLNLPLDFAEAKCLGLEGFDGDCYLQPAAAHHGAAIGLSTRGDPPRIQRSPRQI